MNVTYLLVIVACFVGIANLPAVDSTRTPSYVYMYKDARLKCANGVTWSYSGVRKMLKYNDRPIPCYILNGDTGETRFEGIPYRLVILYKGT